MDFQIIIVGMIIAFASLYFGLMIWRKSKSFSKTSTNNCGNDCGCSSKSASTQITKNNPKAH